MTNVAPNGTKGMGRVPGVMASTTEQSSYSETYIRKDPTDVGFKNACWTFFGLIHVTTDVITIVPSQERRSLLRLQQFQHPPTRNQWQTRPASTSPSSTRPWPPD